MVLLGVLLDNMFDFMVAVLPVVGMLACVFSSGLTAVGFTGLVFLSLSVELSLEWLCMVELNDGDGIGEVQELVEVGVPPVSLLLLLSVVADEGIPTPDNSTSSRPIISS